MPIRKQEVVAQPVRVIQIDRMHRSWQFVFRPDPYLHEYSVARGGHDIRGCSAYHFGLADVVDVLQGRSQVAVGIRHDEVGERAEW